MDWLAALRIDRLADYAHGHVRELAFALSTSFVVVVSGPVNGFLAKFVGSWNFLLRTLVWVAVFTLAYPFLDAGFQHVLRQFLGDQKPVPLLVLVAVAFLAFGIWTGQKRNLR